MLKGLALMCLFGGTAVATFGQDRSPATPAPTTQQSQEGLKQRENPSPVPAGTYRIEAGTLVLLNMINSVSTKQAAPGDRIYLETAFPIVSGNRIVIPQGSW